jgi:hypothetical protein
MRFTATSVCNMQLICVLARSQLFLLYEYIPVNAITQNLDLWKISKFCRPKTPTSQLHERNKIKPQNKHWDFIHFLFGRLLAYTVFFT